jgi:hypothetical protein
VGEGLVSGLTAFGEMVPGWIEQTTPLNKINGMATKAPSGASQRLLLPRFDVEQADVREKDMRHTRKGRAVAPLNRQ